jgi:hypothetical protein
MSDGAARIVVLVSFALFFAASGAVAITPETVWDSDARSSTPTWVQAWVYFMFIIFGAGIAFVRKHSHAWWMVGAFAASHLTSGLEMLLLGPQRLTVGMIAINHCIFWTPATLLFARGTRNTPKTTLFGVWRIAIVGTAVFSVLFDYRDAIAFLRAST